MKTFKIVLGLLLVGALGTLAFGTDTKVAAQPQGPAVTVANVPLPVTGTIADVGQDPSLIVNLRFTNNEPGRRINPATGQPGDPFEVPAGFAFVLTDIRGNAVCTPGSGVLLLLLHNGTSGPVIDRVIASCNGNGDASYERHNTTGVLLAAGSRIVSAMSPTAAGNHFAVGQGYLVPTE
jgi:hypothetical protein